MVYLYWTPRFYIKLTNFAQKIKKTQIKWDICRKIKF